MAATRTPTLVKNFGASGSISPYRIISLTTGAGSSDDLVTVATAATNALFGVTNELSVTTGERVDVVLGGIAPVEYGGTITRGEWLTSDNQGRAIAATADAQQLIGRATLSGVSGDIGAVLITHAVNRVPV